VSEFDRLVQRVTILESQVRFLVSGDREDLPVAPMPDFLTSQQIADKLGVSPRTVWRMVEKGSLPQPIRYNRKLVRWRISDVEKYLGTKEAS